MTDYWLSKLFFDLQSPENLARWRENRDAVLADYPIRAEMREAVLSNDVGAVAPYVNAYLLRFFFSITGMSDPELLDRLHALKPTPSETETV
jgi:hypothetical protein